MKNLQLTGNGKEEYHNIEERNIKREPGECEDEGTEMMNNKTKQESQKTREERSEEEISEESFSSNCVLLQILPKECSENYVRKFFRGLHIPPDGIKIVRDTGTVYVRFMSSEDTRLALKRSGEKLENAFVLVKRAKEKEVKKCLASVWLSGVKKEMERSSAKRRQEEDSHKTETSRSDYQILNKEFVCIVVDGLPSYITEQHVMKLFDEFTVTDVVLEKRRDYSKRQFYWQINPYVQFSTHDDALKALLKARDIRSIGGRLLFFTQTTEKTLQQAKSNNSIIVINRKSRTYRIRKKSSGNSV